MDKTLINVESYDISLNVKCIMVSIIFSLSVICYFLYNTNSTKGINVQVRKVETTDTALSYNSDFFESDADRISKYLNRMSITLSATEQKTDTLSKIVKKISKKKTVIKF